MTLTLQTFLTIILRIWCWWMSTNNP